MTVGDLGLGDMALINGVEYRLMIQLRGGWLCRIGRLGEHVWFEDGQEIDEVTYEQPKRNKKARRDKRKGDISDPVDRR